MLHTVIISLTLITQVLCLLLTTGLVVQTVVMTGANGTAPQCPPHLVGCPSNCTKNNTSTGYKL